MDTRNKIVVITLTIAIASGICASTFGEEILFAERGGVQVWSIPQPPPAPGYLASLIELRAIDPEGTLVTFTNIKTEGRVHQTWTDSHLEFPTPNLGDVQPTESFGEHWSALDSHVLMTHDMMGGCTGHCFTSVTETNDGTSTAHEFLESISTYTAKTGFGDITMISEGDAFFFTPEFQRNTLPYAYIVTDNDPVNGPGEVFLTFGVLGKNVEDAGTADGAHFGYNGAPRIQVPFAVPEPSSAALAVIALTFVGLRRNGLSRRWSLHRARQGSV